MQKQSGRNDLDFQQASKAADAVAQDVPVEFWASSYTTPSLPYPFALKLRSVRATRDQVDVRGD